ncbi:hypothetical protein A6046_05045 [[Haemophilus] ducreyi]|uniref:Sugar phosphate permease, required for N-linked glycosylation n=2 Tax=Haemophilus ducreyi TaxID=730 RepID=G1UBA0_HAEDU|nr:YwiC-like family protein [[Haemophilus] ducreyi]AAN05639.1 conserved hypothetical protein Hd0467 [[Haemophilus] ducreyi]AAP95427.1 hypothetical protein HD_0467 [[Haemophilus] ducreyi 35000HP]AKO30533.1 membrane protein [[Haemophilus] ducreyi]AKO31968.1 membrane protein [[Haemophilus] ducreyi]AKO33423.1 membrane protein [[Haemophilus] ducreyi]
MYKVNPVIPNQHGALVMASIPFVYGMFAAKPIINHSWLALSWLFLYLFSYPFFSLFSKKPTARNKKWAVIYASLSLLFVLPVLWQKPTILQFLGLILPLAIIQIYYAKQQNERHLVNDIAGYLTFGVMGMASFYLATEQVNWGILLHPTLFFIAATFYVKSMVRERKQPLYMELSIAIHLILAISYILSGHIWLFLAYLVSLARAIMVPSFAWNIKKIGLLEFPIMLLFLACLVMT